MGMPGYFYIEIKSNLENETYTRSIQFLGGEGLTWLSAAHTFNKDDHYEYNKSLTEEQIKQSEECDRKFFAKLITNTVDLPDGRHKIVHDKDGSEYKYMLYNEEKHSRF
jgi:hypothetical protein